MNSNKFDDQVKKLIDEIQVPRQSWRENIVVRMIRMRLEPGDRLELRVSNSTNGDVFSLIQRGANAFFTTFSMYPTSVAVHSTVAHLLEASEFSLKATHHLTQFSSGVDLQAEMLGYDFEIRPLHIEIDDSLDVRTVAVRFSIDMEEYGDVFKKVLIESLREMRRSG